MNRYLMVDTETVNSLEDPLFYDLGLAVVDENENVYHTESLVIYETFVLEKNMMKTAYYAEKLPIYQEGLNNKSRRMVRLATAQKIVANLCRKYKVKAIIAHNMRFDSNALNTTLRFFTSSKQRYFLPFNIPIWCTLTMSRQALQDNEDYKEFVKNIDSKVNYRAETIYRYLINDPDFVEDHTGLEDALIESKIFAHCLRVDPSIQKAHYKGGDSPKFYPRKTPIQRRIEKLAKYQTLDI